MHLERSETIVILAATIFISINAALIEELSWHSWFHFHPTIQRFWTPIDATFTTAACVLLLLLYKKLRVGCYPSTFIYCFYMPDASIPSGKAPVVGFCHVKPDMVSGEIVAKGASFVWKNGRLDMNNRTGFASTEVRGTKGSEGEVTCHIHFDIDPADWENRTYHYGTLRFQLACNGVTNTGCDTYAGYLLSTNKDLEPDPRTPDVHAWGYAERYSKGAVAESDVQKKLASDGHLIFAKLDTMLGAVPPPTLWKSGARMYTSKPNIWKQPIPSPQSVILDATLRPYIYQYLDKVLALFGLSKDAIKSFNELAGEEAVLERDNVVAYERALKHGLIGLVVPANEDQALNQRAAIIYGQIAPYLCGDSLLDIGCGNGLIADLARGHFKEIQLLDVVRYLPNALHLPFKLYTEGQPLIDHPFDTVLLLTVLHHSKNPVELLKLAWNATAKHLIIIESVVDVHKAEPSASYELLGLPIEDQIAFAAFVDWFYNRVLHNDVPVPYNFTTPEQWRSIFLENNMRLAQQVHLGQDIDIGPEYHILFVLEK
jgi:SAM-dependent methyltransferase